MSYSDSLKGPEKERYERKLQCLYGVMGRSSKEECVEVLDPYNTYREIGGQKDYAVFGHCVIQCL